MKVPQLKDVLTYKNPRVLLRFHELYPQHQDKADYLFEELLKYLWLGRKHEWDKAQNPHNLDLDFICVMHEEMRMIDEMWHAFIIFTRDYADFCQSYFGHFIHHVPNVVEDQPIVSTDFENQTRLFLDYVYEQLGEETLLNWFGEHLDAA